MLDDKDKMLGEIFENLGGSLDIPPSKYEQAVSRYGSVGRHLEGGTYSHSVGKPAIYCLLYTSPSPRDGLLSRMPSSA